MDRFHVETSPDGVKWTLFIPRWAVKSGGELRKSRALVAVAALRARGVKARIVPVVTFDPSKWLVAAADVDLVHVDKELLTRVAKFGAALGERLTATSGFRSTAAQAALYAKYKAGNGPLAAPPGHSNHERGLAIDAWAGETPAGGLHGAAAVLQRLGLVLGAQGELWHLEKVETGSGMRTMPHA